MELVSFRVRNYRNIHDSGDVQLGRILALVGQNECGKSNLLSALNGLNPVYESKYVVARDWPIDKWPPPEALWEPVCSAKFQLSAADIAAVFEAASPTPADGAVALAQPDEMGIDVTKGYDNTLRVDIGAWAGRLIDAKAHSVIADRLPKCVYIDDYAIFNGSHPNFPDLSNRAKAGQKVKDDERTLLMALDLASLDLGKVVNAPGDQRTYYTAASSATLTRRFDDRWKQKTVSFDIRVDGSTLNIYVKDEGLQAPIPLDQRSAGFRWYVSFVWRFTHASNGEFKNCILLLDEPGVRLHHAGHADLLRFLATLSETNAVIYTTHLATMIDPGFPERLRIIEVYKHHPRVMEGVVSSQAQPMMVIEAALGLAGGMGGLLGNRQNLIVEGVDDMLILQKLSSVLGRAGLKSLSDRVFLLPAHGASKTPMYAAFMVGNGFDAAVLVDSDPAGDAAVKKIKEQRLKDASQASASRFSLLQVGAAVGVKSGEFAIEDLFPASFYLDCVNQAFSTNLSESDLPTTGSEQVVKRVESVLQARNRISGDLNKGIVMAALQKRFASWNTPTDLPAGTADKAEKLFGAIAKAFD